MAEYTQSALSMFTAFFASEDIEQTARRTGFVTRASKMTGNLFLAWVTFGSGSEAKTTLGPWAAKETQVDEQVEGSPEALYQRLNKRALAFLQDLIRHALAKVQAREKVGEDGLFPSFPKGYLADSPGVGRPDSLHDLFPGAGGSAAKAGATVQAVWDDTSRVCGHFALTPWNIPDQQYVDNGGAFAQPCVLFLFD